MGNTWNLQHKQTAMAKAHLWNYSDAQLLFTMYQLQTRQSQLQTNYVDKKVILNICAQFTDCVSGLSNTQVDNA